MSADMVSAEEAQMILDASPDLAESVVTGCDILDDATTAGRQRVEVRRAMDALSDVERLACTVVTLHAERDDALAIIETRNAEIGLAHARVTEIEAALARAERDAMMVSSLRQSVADAEARTAHEAAKHREWEARWYELVHALIEQQGGSVVVYEMTEAERASHLGRSIVEQPLPASRATRYSLAPAEAGGFVASEEIAVGDAVVVKPDGTVAPATPAKKDSDR